METDTDMIPPVRKGRDLALVGAWLQVGPIIGAGITLVGLVRAFAVMGMKVGDPAELSAVIGEAIISSLLGMVIGLVGAVMMLTAVYSSGYRAPWLYWVLLVLGVLYVPAVPVGTIIGAVFIITALAKNQELLAAPRKPQVRQRLW